VYQRCQVALLAQVVTLAVLEPKNQSRSRKRSQKRRLRLKKPTSRATSSCGFWNLQALRHQKQETLPDQEGKMTTLIFPIIHLSQLLSRLRRKLHAAAPTASVVIAVPIILAPIVAAQTAALAAASRIVPSPAAPTAAAMIAGIVPRKGACRR
jgi:hypothetical protein